MGYDMAISGIDKRSIEIVAETLGKTVEEVLLSSYQTSYPFYLFDTTEIHTIFDLSKDLKISMKSLLDKIQSGAMCCLYTTDYFYSCSNVFDGYWEKEPGCSVPVILSKEKFEEMFNWLGKKLQSYDILEEIKDDNFDELTARAEMYRIIYNRMEEIDWDNLIIFFEHDW